MEPQLPDYGNWKWKLTTLFVVLWHTSNTELLLLRLLLLVIAFVGAVIAAHIMFATRSACISAAPFFGGGSDVRPTL
jgi:hypothetical protein